MADKAKPKKRKAKPDVSHEVKVVGKLKIGQMDYYNKVSKTDYEYEVIEKASTRYVKLTAPCGETYYVAVKALKELVEALGKKVEVKLS